MNLELSIDTPRARRPVIPNGVLGMLMFIFTEVMFFAALISAYSIVRSSAIAWPPLDQPRLPVAISAINTVILLSSGVLVFFANRAFVQKNNTSLSQRLIGLACALASAFILIQGNEWLGLIRYGLTMTSSTYGSFFYLIVGSHALHAFVALFLLLRVFRKGQKGQLTEHTFWTAQAFWYFVVGIWPLLYVFVYL